MSTCGCCGDSAFATTGNVVGILTFALGLVASYVAFYALTRGALYEIETFSRDLERVKNQTIPFIQFCENEKVNNSNFDFEAYEVSLKQALTSLMDSLEALWQDLQALHRFNRESRNPLDFQARRRFAWVYRRQSFVERMSVVSSRQAEVQSVQTSLLLSKVTSLARDNAVQTELLQTLIAKFNPPAEQGMIGS